MGKAIPFDYRKKIVARKKEGDSSSIITHDYGYSESGINKIWYRYKKEGDKVFTNNYQNCGQSKSYDKKLRDCCNELRDNKQGGTYVRSKLEKEYSKDKIPHERTIQRWWQEQGLNTKKGRPSNKEKSWSVTAHETWQIDGKDRIGLSAVSTEEEVSWMSIADEGTTSHLQATVYSCSQVAEINEQQALQDINGCFEKFGMPENIKIDNGKPFVNPKNRDVPTKSILWWVGLGINVIQNPPRTPQDNGAVENLQGTLYRWTKPSIFDNIEDFQNKINEESKFQRESYRIPSKGYKTRKELFPELETNKEKRKFTPELFDIQNVYEFLATKIQRFSV